MTGEAPGLEKILFAYSGKAREARRLGGSSVRFIDEPGRPTRDAFGSGTGAPRGVPVPVSPPGPVRTERGTRTLVHVPVIESCPLVNSARL
jgi:hypothetical protein